MRKVSREVITAFLKNETRKVGNTYTNRGFLYLYGNQIASNINGTIRIFDGGFATATTKERLNALLQLMNDSGNFETVADCIYQRNYQWFIQFNNNDKGKFINGTCVGVAK